jgi:KDO2-lipid IV(A) lauroyltransferase
MTALFRLLSYSPLWVLHACGWGLGWLVYLSSSTYRRRFSENTALAGLGRHEACRAVGEAGKLVTELPRLWFGSAVPVEWDGAEHVAAALKSGHGIVFLTPHLGCFEVTAQAYAARFGQGAHPMTVLFRQPRNPWLARLVLAARARPGLRTAPATLAGVKQLIKALKSGECVGLLPDQVPPDKMGIWSPFFGKPAYTMTLSARLALQTGAAVLLAWGERRSWGRGYVIHVRPLGEALSPDLERALLQVSRAMEGLIHACPSQYLWGYGRYKPPRAEL